MLLYLFTFAVIWKYLSLDFSALTELRARGPAWEVHSLLDRFIPDVLSDALLSSPGIIRVGQLAGAGLLVVGAAIKSRVVYFFGLLPLLLIEESAWAYRNHLLDAEILFPLLLLAVLWPTS